MSKSKEMITTQTMQNIKEFSWCQKYRPLTLDDVILPSHIMDPIMKMVREDKKIPHLLFTSVLPGSGKSTLSQCIINELGADYLKINASKDNGIGVIRDQVDPFAMRQSLYANAPKVVFLDEFDGTTPQFQDAFRVPMESYSQTCSFIMTANYKEKISLAIQDRTQMFDFNLQNAKIKKELLIQIVKRVIFILDAEGVEYDTKVLMQYCNERYPRIRNIITDIQKYVTGNGMILDKGIMSLNVVDDDFYQTIFKGDFTNAKSYLFKNSLNIDGIFTNLYKNFLPMIKDDKARYGNSLVTINQYMCQNSMVVDKEINMVALLLELCTIMKG